MILLAAIALWVVTGHKLALFLILPAFIWTSMRYRGPDFTGGRRRGQRRS